MREPFRVVFDLEGRLGRHQGEPVRVGGLFGCCDRLTAGEPVRVGGSGDGRVAPADALACNRLDQLRPSRGGQDACGGGRPLRLDRIACRPRRLRFPDRWVDGGARGVDRGAGVLPPPGCPLLGRQLRLWYCAPRRITREPG